MISLRKVTAPLALFGVLFTTTALSGCQSSCTGDARFDGYYCARSNISNGTYTQQTAQLRQTANSRQAQADQLRRKYNSAQARLRTARSNPSTSASEVLRLEREVNSLQRALDQYAG
ncbi:OmpH family outer membrane protein [Bartonella sp. LJL80]